MNYLKGTQLLSTVMSLHHQGTAQTIPWILSNSQESDRKYMSSHGGNPKSEALKLFWHKENHSTCCRNERHVLRLLWHLFEILKTAVSSISLKLTPTEILYSGDGKQFPGVWKHFSARWDRSCDFISRDDWKTENIFQGSLFMQINHFARVEKMQILFTGHFFVWQRRTSN